MPESVPTPTSPASDATRIVRIITRLNIGGPSIQAIHLSDRLNAAGFRTVLIHGQLGEAEGDMRYLLPEQGVETRYVPSLKRPLAPLADVRAFWQIFWLLWHTRPALVHTHMAKAGTLGRAAAIAYNFTRGRGAPARLVHTYHGHVLEGYFQSRLAKVFVLTERILARFTDTLVAISPQIRRELVELHRIGREAQYRVVPLGFDLAPFAAITPEMRTQARTELGLSGNAPVVTTVGRLTAIKQHRLFLEMAQQVVRRHPGATFLIAGDGELRAELERSVQEAGLGDRVRFLGWRRDLSTLYAATDVFVITSRNEGTPVALIEAMAAGVPGVSTDVGGVSDVITDPGLGTLVPFGDAGALAEAVSRLLGSPEERCQIGQRARASVLARYDLQRLVGDIAQLYRTLRAQ